MSRSAWSDDIDSELGTDRIPPIWTVKNLEGTDNQKLLDWLNLAYDIELKQITQFREQCMRHVAMFRGKFYSDITGRSGFAEASQQGLGFQSTRPSKLVVNHLYDLTIQRVSRVTRNKPAIAVNPANSEYKDKVSARILKFWVDYLLYENDFEALVAECAQSTYIMGESYIASRWNPDAGELMDEWKEETESASRENRVPRVMQRNAEGEPVTGTDGEPLFIEKGVKKGDVELEVWTPLDTIVQHCGDFKKANYWFHEEYMDVDEVTALYPDAKEIKADGERDDLTAFRKVAEIDIGPASGKVLVRHFRHKPNQFMSAGRYIISTRTSILKNTKLSPKETGLALARLTDIDVPKRQHGLSFYEHGKRINAAINDLTSMGMRNTKMMSNPKWVVPRGSVIKKDALGNDITIIEYQGAIEPKIVVPPPLNTELSSMRADLKQDLQMILGVFDISRGQVPANIRSAMALQLVDDQEDQRANSSVAKHSSLIRNVIINSINVASAYYEKDDKRLLPIVGRENRYMVKEFDPTHLSKSYDVRVSNSSGMPNSKAARTEMILELGKIYPQAIPPQKLFELLQWGDQDGFYDETTAAVKAASAENEAMLNDEGYEEPTIYEDLMIHWTTHVNEVQNRSFKVSTPKEIQERFVAHIGGTEYLMLDRAKKNPAFALKLMEQPLFPLVFEPSMEDFMLLDRARTGNPMGLQEVQILYSTGMLPPPGMGPTQPAGGINNGVEQVGPMAGNAVAQAAAEGGAPPLEGAPVAPAGPVS